MKDFLINTLTNKFNTESYHKFASEFFNDLNFDIKELSIDEGYSKHIDNFKLIGEYIDPDGKKLHVLEVQLVNNAKIKNARTIQRDLVARHIKNYWLDGALVAFYFPDSSSWRLSFVKIEYKFDDKGRAKEELTPSKRYSFLVGVNEPSHTAQQQLLPLIKEVNYNPTIKEIEDSFSVEKVTKEFFGKYKELFELTAKELNKNSIFQEEASKNNIITENFTKKLLGQIVFLYFLQKKGWLGVSSGKSWGDGDRNFLKHLFEDAISKDKNFFNDYLEILFYDTLNNPRRNSVDPSFSKYFKSRIPFLNGGLFEPEYNWKKTDICLDNSIFEKILNVFDLYNFTVKEDEPLEKEVAVDPEMLGKIFENLLEENLRKGKGAYYTPREIVHYMCQESLINHLITETKVSEKKIRTLVTRDIFLTKEDIINLKNNKKAKKKIIDKILVFWEEEIAILDKALINIKIVDPACGSGAFLIGMLHEIIKARQILQMYRDDAIIDEYHLKKETIQNCIYGVDIDPSAIEIAKLRLWLSLVVDYNLEEIEPLPNLDYKIMQGNSLLEELVLGDTSIRLFDAHLLNDRTNMKNLFDKECQKDLFGESEKNDKIVKDYRKLQIEFFNESNHDLKAEIKDKLFAIEIDLIEQSVESEMKTLNAQNNDLGKYLISGFATNDKDAIKLQKNLSKQAQIMKVLDELKKSGIRPFFLWRLYFADVFEGNGGFDIVIANPPYIFTRDGGFGIDIKKHIYDKFLKHLSGSQTGHAKQSGKINLYAIFILQSVSLLKDKGHLSYILPNTLLRATTYDVIRKYILDNTKIINITDLSSGVFENVTASVVLLFLQNSCAGSNNKILISEGLPTKSENKISPMKQDNFYRNISYAFNIFSDKGSDAIVNKAIRQGQRLDVFVDILAGGIATGPGKKNYISDTPLSLLHKPLIEGKDVKKYCVTFNNKYILYDRKKLYRAREESLFLKKEKLITQRIGGGKCPLIVAYDDNQYYTFNSTNSIFLKKGVSMPLKYILALLNSKLLNWFYTVQFTNKSSLTVNISKTFLEQLPIVDSDNKNELVSLVDDILKITNSQDYLINTDKRLKVEVIERQIDLLVYNLYDLTKAEIKTVEDFNQ